MQVTQADLRQQCGTEHEKFVRCIAARADPYSARCAAEQRALEQCATAWTQLVTRINASCERLYMDFTECCAGTKNLSDCEQQQNLFWQCANRQI
mmetsp:Transcript_44771/g.74271  ORF Transcript_44771/g.74271 Transcript_44771/m.74271 type:complete len:95 (-) Transcript_44771:314-598(-)